MSKNLIMHTPSEVYFDSSKTILSNLYPHYRTHSKAVIAAINHDKKLSEFDRFNRRFKISWGLKIDFTDTLPIRSDYTRQCYLLMIKIADLWFAFEHLVETASYLIPKDACLANKSKTDLYQESTLLLIGFHSTTDNFNALISTHLVNKPRQRRELYLILAYIKKNIQNKTKKLIEETITFIKNKQNLHTKHILALCYGIRNIYAHNGVAAALGSKNYRFKQIFYLILYDSLVLYALSLGNHYCIKYLESMALPPLVSPDF